MDNENLKSWVSRPDVCRCCLSTSGSWDVTASYISDTGSTEIYSDMLRDCYGITLSHVTPWGPSRMVCSLCLGQLRDACVFRKQVLQSEKIFNEYCSIREKLTLKEPNCDVPGPDASDGDPQTDGVKSNDRLLNNAIREICGMKEDMVTRIEKGLLKSFGNVERMNESRLRIYESDVIIDKIDDVLKKGQVRNSRACIKNVMKVDEAKEVCKTSGLCLPLCENGSTLSDDDKTTLHLNPGDDIVKSEIENEPKRKERKTEIGIAKKNPADNIIDYDSDEPIAFIMNRNVSDEERLKDRGKVFTETAGENPIGKGFQQTTSIVATKHVSERKRGIVTCHTVLTETTACPFRHHKSWFQCFFCTEEFVEINQLRSHTQQNHSDVDAELRKMKRYPRSLQIEISNLECRNCHLDLNDVVGMCRHLGEIHNKVIYSECIADFKLDVSPYTCHLCQRQFHVFRTLTTHLNEHYANCICDVCGKSFLNSKRLKVHKRTHEAGQFPCNECGKVLKTKISRSNHIENAHSKRQMKCQICFKPMKHYNDRIKHMSEAHNITHKFQCPICGREYNIKHYLATHIRQTHGHKNKKCLECGMAFITNHGLKKHMLRHSGEKPYCCTVCGKSYARSYTLKEHMRAHEGDSFG